MDIKKIIEQLKNKELTPEMLFPKELFFVIAYYWKNGNKQTATKLSLIAKKRLEDKGFQWCPGIGWCKTKDIPFMGISLKNGIWSISDKAKYNGYNSF